MKMNICSCGDKKRAKQGECTACRRDRNIRDGLVNALSKAETLRLNPYGTKEASASGRAIRRIIKTMGGAPCETCKPHIVAHCADTETQCKEFTSYVSTEVPTGGHYLNADISSGNPVEEMDMRCPGVHGQRNSVDWLRDEAREGDNFKRSWCDSRRKHGCECLTYIPKPLHGTEEADRAIREAGVVNG